MRCSNSVRFISFIHSSLFKLTLSFRRVEIKSNRHFLPIAEIPLEFPHFSGQFPAFPSSPPLERETSVYLPAPP